jgi:hypothetical protein
MRWKHLALVGGPVTLVTLVLLLGTSGGATARLGDVSVFHGQGLLAGIGAWIGNYFKYFSPEFLFIRGDPNPRHSSGFGGMLFVTVVPALILGVVTCVRRWRDPMCRLALLGLFVAPVGPALTEGVSARRDVVFLPFMLVALAYGWQTVLPLLRGHALRVAAAVSLVVVAAGAYFTDYVVAYPARAAPFFDTGEVPALIAAHDAAGGHTILVSTKLPDIPEEALFALLPPPSGYEPPASMHLVPLSSASQLAEAQRGDIAVLAGTENAPAGFTRIDEESISGPTSLRGPSVRLVLVDVYQRR